MIRTMTRLKFFTFWMIKGEKFRNFNNKTCVCLSANCLWPYLFCFRLSTKLFGWIQVVYPELSLFKLVVLDAYLYPGGLSWSDY